VNTIEQQKLRKLILKYNPILKESIENALTEDLFNLIIVNKDDRNFELKDMLSNKKELKSFVMKEFIQFNNKLVTSELKNMKEIKLKLVKSNQGKLKL
jgi:hypothetical protein